MYRILASLMSQPGPAWFKSNVAAYLSARALRPGGVRHLIEFMATADSKSLRALRDSGESKEGADDFSISSKVVEMVTMLLSHPSAGTTAERYFETLAPQLLHLLDGDGGVKLSQVAASVISRGILSKQKTGALGSVGWTLFVAPCHAAIDPRDSTEKGDHSKALVPELTLGKALLRLKRIIISNPSPAVTGRLIRPILLALWAIYCYRGAPAANSSAKTLAFSLLDKFFTRSGTVVHLKLILANLLIDGGSNWQLGPGSSGGIEIRSSTRHTSKDSVPDPMKIDDRTSAFAKVAANVDKETMGEFFVFLIKRHLLPRGHETDLGPSDELQDLIQVDLLQKLLPVARDAFSTSRVQILHLIRQMFQDCSEVTSAHNSPRKISLASLSNIVQEDQDSTGSHQLSDDMIVVATSLLNAIIGDPDVKREVMSPIMHDILGSLTILTERPPTYLSEATVSSIGVSRSLAQTFLSKPDAGRQTPAETSNEMDQQLVSQVTADLTSELPPIRTSAIHALQRLIKTPSVTIDTPTITLLLLNQIRTEPDEYVHLAAISALSTLAATRDSSFVVRTTASAFQDADEAATVDQRLRIGEALTAIVEALTSPELQFAMTPATRELLRRVADTATAVAGRRGSRAREANERAGARARQRDAEREWGGEVPDLAALQRRGDADDDGRSAAERDDDRLAQRVVDAWAGAGGEEDARLRASALGVLARALERAGAAMTPGAVRAAAEVALGALGGGLEAGEGRAVVRRAAALVLMAHLLAVDRDDDASGGGGIATLDAETWAAAEAVLERAREGDGDALVRAHAGDVLESLEAWRMRRIARAAADGRGEGGELGLTSVRGLPDLRAAAPSGRIQVVEESDS
jgi:hypothetical protein